MDMKCEYVAADEAGGEIFQVLFEAKRDQLDGPYLLLQRAFLEEDDDLASSCCIETNEQRLCGHYFRLEAELTRDRLTLHLPPPADDTINVHFIASDRTFRKVDRMLGIIMHRNIVRDEERNANKVVHFTFCSERAN